MKIRHSFGDGSWACSLCAAAMGSEVLAFEDVPYILGVTDQTATADRTVSFSIGACPSCGLVHHNHEISGEMYSEIHSHAVGKVWEDHFQAFVAFIGNDRTLGRVLEIGPSTSPVARGLTDGSAVAYVDFMEQAPFPLKTNETYYPGYFPHAGLAGERFDTIIASHVLEHAPALRDFFANLTRCLAEQGALFLSIPNFEEWIGQKFWNAFSLEHASYPVERQIWWLAQEFGMRYELSLFRDHSVFIKFEKGSNLSPAPDTDLWATSVIPWQACVNDQVLSFERSVGSGPLYLTGASHLSQYVLNMSPVLRAKCLGVFDNARAKHGKRLYGTYIQVLPFQTLVQITGATVIVPASPYQKEIREQISSLAPTATVIAA